MYTRLIPTAIAVVIATVAAAQDPGDIAVGVEAGAIVTGAVNANQTVEFPVQVFTGVLGDSGFPAFTTNPGFDSAAGTFPVDTSIGFNVLEALTVWSGDGFDVTGGETLTISFLSLAVTTGDGFTPGFELAVQPNGGFHRHYAMVLNGEDGNAPAPGVYLLVREMYSTSPAIGPSEPFSLLLAHDAAPGELEAAEAWLLSSLEREEEAWPHADIWLQPFEGAMVTGAIGEGAPGEPIAARWRVFASELGEDEQFPYSAVEPGFQMLGDQTMANASLWFGVGAVQTWTGSAFDSSDVVIEIALGPLSIVAGSEPVGGFTFAAQPDGSLHLHFDFTLAGPRGTPPASGIHLLPMWIEGVSPRLDSTPTFFIVFNNGDDEATHREALTWTRLTLACGADLDGNGTVDGADLGLLLASWGGADLVADLDTSGVVDGADLGLLLAGWGPCA